MTAYLHHPTGLETGTVYRADTASGSSTPTTVYTDRAAAQPIANGYGLTGSTLRAGGTSADPGVGFYSSVQTIYLKPVTYQGVLVGSGTVTSTGAGTDPTPNPLPSSLFEQVWATPAASTTLTGTLAAWTVTSVDCTAGPGARALPAASSVAVGVAVCAKKSDTSSNALVVSRAGSDLIFGMGSGGTSKTLNLPGETAELVSNGVDRWTVRASDTPVSQLDARYNSTYAQQSTVKPAAGRRWCFLGDSITNGSGASNFAYSFSKIAVDMAGSASARLDFLEAGTTGYTAASADTYLTTLLATYPDIGGLVVLIGTNDTSTAGPTALSSYQASLTSIVAKAKAKGIPTVVCTIPPKAGANATSTSRPAIAKANMWLRLWAPAQGCEVAEVYGVLADTTTGDLLTAYDSGDGIHPSSLGHARIAQVVAQAMKRLNTARSSASLFTLGTGISLVQNPLMAGALGAGLPTNWYEQPGGTGTAPTYSKVADTTGLLPAGQWAEMDFDGTASGGLRIFATTPPALGGAVGDTLAFTGTILVEDLNGTWEANVVNATIGVTPSIRTQTAAALTDIVGRCPGVNLGNLYGTGNNVWQLGPFFSPFVIPAGVTGLFLYNYVGVPTGSHIKAHFGAMDIINLTTLGLTSIAGGAVSSAVNLNGP